MAVSDRRPVIRRAEERDFPALVRLYREFHRFHVAGVPTRLCDPERVDEDEVVGMLRKIAGNERAALLVAEAEDRVVGLAETYLKETEPSPYVVQRRYALLQSLVVTEAERGMGVGARLVAAVHQWARDRGASEVEVETWEFPAGPLRFYESLGYRTVKRRLARDL